MKHQEIEAKFYVKDLKQIEKRLHALKAKRIHRRVYESNLRFDTAKRDLRRAGCVLRLRQDDQARLTYKGPGKRKSGVTRREEIEFVVENFTTAKKFVESLGYEVMVLYEKYRTTYELKKTHIMLDELPYGNFVEVEGESISSIQRVAKLLGLRWNAAIAASYQAMFERLAEKRKMDTSQLTFKAFKKRPTAKELKVIEAD